MMIGSDRRRALVVGGGPAGAAAALLLARAGHSTTIAERTCGNGWRAGETLPPVAAEVLRALGVWERFLADGHRPSRRTASAWGDDRLHLETTCSIPMAPAGMSTACASTRWSSPAAEEA